MMNTKHRDINMASRCCLQLAGGAVKELLRLAVEKGQCKSYTVGDVEYFCWDEHVVTDTKGKSAQKMATGEGKIGSTASDELNDRPEAMRWDFSASSDCLDAKKNSVRLPRLASNVLLKRRNSSTRCRPAPSSHEALKKN